MAGQLCEDKSREMVSSSGGGGGGGFCYSEVSSENPSTMQSHHHMVNHIQQGGFDPEMFNLTTGMEMIGFSKNLEQSDAAAATWKSFFPKPHGQHHHQGPSTSSTTTNNTFYHHHDYKSDFTSTDGDNLMPAAAWQENNRTMVVEDSSSMRCVFPCEGNERPSQGLSLSLSSANPSTIGLQSFELRHTTTTTHHHNHNHNHNHNPYNQGAHFVLKNSKYLLPAQHLLNEFCSLATNAKSSLKTKHSPEEDDLNGCAGASSSKKHALTSLELVELQKRKTKLLAMLEEVERRYRNYRSQMKAVAASFEAVAGNGAGTVYTAMALKAMSRHCKRLKDGIMGQIQVTRKAMGEKDPIAPGTTRGETPRLKIIDQAIRQQRAFQQMSIMETHPWRPQRGLPERSVSVLRAWLFEHFLHPYPSDVDKHILARQTGLSRSQVSNWFINARVRLWKPMVEEMYLEEVKEHENNMGNSSEGGIDAEEDTNPNISNFHNPADTLQRSEDRKPTPDRLIRIDSECASSSMLINNNNNNKNEPSKSHHHMNPQEHCLGDTFGSMELDFSSYAHQHQQQGFNGGGGVSLTLGLQQHGGNGVNLAFPASGASHHHNNGSSTLFYPMREHQMNEDCSDQAAASVVQYSLLDADAQNLPYRNLMGAQLLHDLAG